MGVCQEGLPRWKSLLFMTKDLNLFCGSAWAREVSAVLNRDIDVSFPSQIVVLLCCSMGRILRYQTALYSGKSNCYVELCELLSISEFQYPVCKTKGAGLLFCFLSCCLCLDSEHSGTGISMCTVSVIISFCLVAVLLLYYEELATTPKYLPNFALHQKNI